MNRLLAANRILISLVTPMVLYLGVILLVKSSVFPANSDIVNLALTIDLLVTIPLVYFILNRKTTIPGTTVIAVIATGALVGTYFLPQTGQIYLNWSKTWLLPVVELVVLSYIIIKVRSSFKKFRSLGQDSADMFTALKGVCYTFLPAKLVLPFATEVAVIYYGFISWKKRPLHTNEFSYHRESSAMAILGALILMSLVETFVLHLLLSKWNPTVAWVITGISLYTILQIWGLIKSIARRPIHLNDTSLTLRYGLLNEACIELRNIVHFELSSKELEEGSEIRNLSPLGKLEGHNVIIYLKEESELTGFYGIKKRFKALAFHVDDSKGFRHSLENALLRV